MKKIFTNGLRHMESIDRDLEDESRKRQRAKICKSCDTCIKEDKHCDKEQSIKCLSNDFSYYERG